MNSQNIKFTAFDLEPEILEAINQKGFEQPTEIQLKTLTQALNSSEHIVGKAQTGTGKTAAFGLPILNALDPKIKTTKSLILCPTRELAVQVTEELNSLKGTKKLFATAVYGGQSYEQQLRRLKHGDQIIVGTPGRVVDHIKRGTLKLHELDFFVLDEADEMLNMGFMEELDFILDQVPETSQKFFFSATMPKRIEKLVQKYIPSYKLIEVASTSKVTSLSKQQFLEVNEGQKFDALCMLIDRAEKFYGIVFCRTKVEVDGLTLKLNKRGYQSDCIHGDIAQRGREKVLAKFKKQEINILVATDVAARGIDVEDLNYVINYHLPEDAESYVHRVGRTGRAGKSGFAITLVSGAEYRRLEMIKRVNKLEMEEIKPPKKSDMQDFYIEKICKELEHSNSKGKFYEKLYDRVLEEFEPGELILKLLSRSFKDFNIFEFEPINKNASSGRRGRGGFRGKRHGGDRRSGGGSRFKGKRNDRDRNSNGKFNKNKKRRK